MSADAPLSALDRLLEVTLVLEADMRRDLQRVGLTAARAGVVWTLEATGPSTQRDLARTLGVSPRNVTGLVDGLVETGFVTREPHPTDRRATHVTLTRDGAATARRLVAGRRELAEQLFGDLPAAEVERLAERLGDVAARLNALIAEAGA